MRAFRPANWGLKFASGLVAATGIGGIGCSDYDDDYYVHDGRPDTVIVEHHPRAVYVEPARRPSVVHRHTRADSVIVHEAPPRLRVERRTPSPGRDHVWIDGHWRHDGKAYQWESGRYERQRPNKRWESARWDRERDGWRYHEGGWRD